MNGPRLDVKWIIMINICKTNHYSWVVIQVLIFLLFPIVIILFHQLWMGHLFKKWIQFLDSPCWNVPMVNVARGLMSPGVIGRGWLSRGLTSPNLLKMLETSNVIDPTKLFQKLWNLLIPLISIHKSIPGPLHTPFIQKLRTWINREIMKYLYMTKCSSFLMIYPI